MKIQGPKETRAFVFYIIAVLCLWEFGNSLRRIFTSEYFVLAMRKDPVLSFVPTKNTGGAFSILPEYTILLAVLGIIAVLVTTFCVYRFVEFKEKIQIISACLFAGGILGNVSERLLNGYVLDYIKLNFVDFAIFNAFDAMICTSVLLFTCFILFEEIFKKIKKAEK